MSGPPAVLVNASSATHSRPGEDQAHDIHAVNRNHSEMVKFGHRDVDYTIVLGFLEEFAVSATDIIEARFLGEKRGGTAPDFLYCICVAKLHPQTRPVGSPDVELHELDKSMSCN